MKIAMKLLALSGLLLVSAVANAAVVEPFNGAMRPDWSQGIGAPDPFGLTAPDGAPAWSLSDATWAYNTAISFKPGDTMSAWFNPGLVVTPGQPTFGGGRLFLGFGADANGAVSFMASSDTTLPTMSFGFQDNAGYGHVDLSGKTFTWNDQWYLLQVKWNLDGSALGSVLDQDGTTLLDSLLEPGFGNLPSGIALKGFGGVDVAEISITVAEPASFAMLLAGFGIAGAALRRRPR
jgi:hypothetical protein